MTGDDFAPVRDAADRLLADHVDRAVLRSASEGVWPAGLWRAVEDAGLPLALVSEARGGVGLPVADGLALVEIAARHAAPIPLAETIVAAWLLDRAGLDIPSGPLTVMAGAHAERVPWAAWTTLVCLVGDRLVVVPPGRASIAPGRNLAGEPRDAVTVDPAGLVDAPSPIAEADLDAIMAGVRAMQIAGALARVTALAARYAQERVQFGKPIARFQAIQQQLAVLRTQAAAAAAAGDLARAALASGRPFPGCAIAKARAGEAAGIGAAIAHQVHGAIGFTLDHDLQYWTKRLWSWRDDYGAEPRWATAFGRDLLAEGGAQLWPALTACDPSPDPDREHLRDEVRAFLATELAGRSAAEKAQSWAGFDSGFSRRLGARGWIGMTWPTAYGGHDRSALDRYVVLEETLAAGAPVSAHWIADRQSGPLLLRYGTEAQRETFLPRIASGELCFSIGLSEPDTGSDLASARMRAVADGDPGSGSGAGGWIVNGSKIWTTNGHRSQYMVLFCRTDPVGDGGRHAGFSQFVVDMGLPGIEVRAVPDLAGEHHINQIHFTDVRLGPDALVGTLGGGWAQVIAELANERSGPERFLSSFQLLVELVDRLGPGASDAAAAAVGRLAAHIAVLRRLSLAVATAIDAGRDPGADAAIVKDLGAVLEQEIPEIARLLVASPPDPAGDDYQAVLAATMLAAPSFSLRGGAREILRGIIARDMDLR